MGHVKTWLTVWWCFFLYWLTWLLDEGALLDTRHTNNQEESETQEQQAQGGNKQGVFSLEGRRLRENMMAEVKYEKDHYMGEESGTCGLLKGQWVGLQGSRIKLNVRKDCLTIYTIWQWNRVLAKRVISLSLQVCKQKLAITFWEMF